MEVLSFDICGKFAHFRKFYSNSSALTHFVPPRTTIAGIIAGIIGLEKDTYYETFSLASCDIGVRLLSRVKKSIQNLKYLKVEQPNHLNGSYFDSGKRRYTPNTMVPFEFLSPPDIKQKNCFVSYRCYYHPKTNFSRSYFEKLKNQLINGKECIYPLSLGTANFSGFITGFSFYDETESRKTSESVLIHSVIPVSCLTEFPVSTDYHLIQETLPMEFDKDRYLKKHSEIIFDLKCNPLDVKINDNYFLLTVGNHKENIVFMK